MSRLIRIMIKLAALITFSILFLIIGYILVKGLPNIKPSLFALEYTTENVSLFPAIVTLSLIHI